MQKRNMTVGQDYAFSVGYGRKSLGDEWGLQRGRLVRFDGDAPVFDPRHEKSGRSQKADQETTTLAKVYGTWEQHLEKVAEKAQVAVERAQALQAEADLRNKALSFLDETLPGWDQDRMSKHFGGKKRYEVTPSMSPRDYFTGAREQVNVERDQSAVYYGEDKVTVVYLAALVKASFEAGRQAEMEA